MKSIVKLDDKPGLDIVEVPVPKISEDDVLIKVSAASICGSDLPIYSWDDLWTRKTVKPGQIIGHEFCGTIVDIGKKVTDFRINQRVTAEGHLYCGHCFYCVTGQAHICEHQRLIGFDHPGAFAEYIAVPSRNVVPIDADVPFGTGALLDPLGNALHAVSKAHLFGSRVLVTGCGPIGLMTVILSKLAGAQLVVSTDTSEYRLQLARQLGVDQALHPSEIEKWMSESVTTIPYGFDVWFEMSGNSNAIATGFHFLRAGGQAVLLGLPKHNVDIDVANMIVAKNVIVTGVIGRQIKETWIQMMRLLENRRFVRDLISIVTHRFALEQYKEAFELAQSRQCGKIVLLPSHEMAQQFQILV